MQNPDQNARVVVFGATGKVGSQVLRYLSEAGISCRAVTRDLSKSKELPFVDWVQGDIDNQSEIPRLIAGADRVFLNSGVSEKMVQVQNNIIDSARDTGIGYIIKLSTPAAREDSKDPVGRWHWEVQEHLRGTGLSWNVLQPQSFMQNWLGDFASTIKTERKIYASAGSGKRAFTDTRDIGRVAASLFESPDRWSGQIIPLSCDELVSFYDVAHAFSQAIGETVTYVPQTPEEARQRLQKKGVPDFLINLTLLTEHNQKTGVAEKLISHNIAQILQKPAFTIYDFAEAYQQAFI